jgi:phosphoenolpyruvate carboxykinase (GTP)
LPFCGYNMADYMRHWLEIGRKGDAGRLPRIFIVNWFRKDDEGNFIWPGFGENIRVLEWVLRRCGGVGGAVDTLIGRVPAEGEIDTSGLDLSEDDLRTLLSVDREDVNQQLPQVEAHLAQFGHRLPEEIAGQLEALKRRLA